LEDIAVQGHTLDHHLVVLVLVQLALMPARKSSMSYPLSAFIGVHRRSSA